MTILNYARYIDAMFASKVTKADVKKVFEQLSELMNFVDK